MTNLKTQTIFSYILLAAGVTLIFSGFWVTPVGVIHNSVLMAVGEIFTLIGSIMGIKTNYAYKLKSLEKDLSKKKEK